MEDGQKWIAILGEPTLQNELLVYALSREIGAEASIEESFPLFEQEMSESGIEDVLCLVDAGSALLDRAMATCKAWNRTGRVRCTVALYNLQKQDHLEQSAISKGVKGFFYVKDSLGLLVKGVFKLFDGEIWVPRELLFALAQNGHSDPEPQRESKAQLTNREMQVLAHVCTGLSNEEIAESLNLSPHTVKTHLYRIFKKIYVSNRFQASLWAAKHL